MFSRLFVFATFLAILLGVVTVGHAQTLSRTTTNTAVTTSILYQLFAPTKSNPGSTVEGTDPQMITGGTNTGSTVMGTDPQMIKVVKPGSIYMGTDPQM